VIQIEAGLDRRQSRAITNFTKALPAPQSDLARHLLKDPYNFDFLALSKDADEREVENGLVGRIQKFLQELGTGFSFLGRQYPLKVAGEDYRLDPLFYHIKLRWYLFTGLSRVATVERRRSAGAYPFTTVAARSNAGTARCGESCAASFSIRATSARISSSVIATACRANNNAIHRRRMRLVCLTGRAPCHQARARLLPSKE